MTKLFDLPEMSKPSASDLRGMIDTVSAIYDSLLSIGDDKKISTATLIHLVMFKVDPVSKSKWDEQLDFDKQCGLTVKPSLTGVISIFLLRNRLDQGRGF